MKCRSGTPLGDSGMELGRVSLLRAFAFGPAPPAGAGLGSQQGPEACVAGASSSSRVASEAARSCRRTDKSKTCVARFMQQVVAGLLRDTRSAAVPALPSEGRERVVA